jgi:hypothetical protein
MFIGTGFSSSDSSKYVMVNARNFFRIMRRHASLKNSMVTKQRGVE